MRRPPLLNALLVLPLILASACDNSGSPGAIASIAESQALSTARKSFSEIVGGFEESSEELSTALDAGKDSLLSFQSSVNEARERNPDFDAVYVKWGEVERKTGALKKKFEELVAGADAFYVAAEAHASSISDDALKSETLDAIATSRNAYVARLTQTKADIAPLDAMKQKVDDTMKALEIRFAIEVVDERIKEMLEEVSAMVIEAMGSLRALQDESKSVLEGLS
jgi:hypothetical protein